MALYLIEHILRNATMLWKQMTKVFKSKEPANPFLKTVKIWNPNIEQYMELKMMLDTGCEVYNLITWDAVNTLQLADEIISQTVNISTCLNGEPLSSIGTLVLRWKGKSFRKIFTTTFHIIDGVSLPWDVILGAKTIQEHGILKFAGFAGSKHILPKDNKDETKMNRKREQEEKAAANKARIEANKNAKKEASKQSRSHTKK